MEIQELTAYFAQYGPVFVFVIVFLEYLNLPGFPSGVILPLAGIWASRGEVGILTVVLLSVTAGLMGSWVLYFLGRKGGETFLGLYIKHFPKQKDLIYQKMEELRRKGAVGVFAAKLIPVARTFISIPAGMIAMNFGTYTVSSLLGVFVWNLLFIGAGYLLGDSVFTLLT